MYLVLLLRNVFPVANADKALVGDTYETFRELLDVIHAARELVGFFLAIHDNCLCSRICL